MDRDGSVVTAIVVFTASLIAAGAIGVGIVSLVGTAVIGGVAVD